VEPDPEDLVEEELAFQNKRHLEIIKEESSIVDENLFDEEKIFS